MNAELNIRPCEYSKERYECRLNNIPGWTYQSLVDKAETLTTHYFEQGEDDEFAIYEPRGYERTYIQITGSELIIYGTFSHDDPDDNLDGTQGPPTSLSLDNRIEIIRLVKHFLA